MKVQAFPDAERCRRIGEILGKLRIRNIFYERPFLKEIDDIELKYSMLFNAVAICHQTRNLACIPENLFGWDYLEGVFLSLAKTRSWLLFPDEVVARSTIEVSDALLSAFSCKRCSKESTLDRIEERSRLSIGLNQFVKHSYGALFSEIVKNSGGYLRNNGNGFYEILASTEAFSDPKLKKASFLFKLLMEAGLTDASDPENYIPVMDYHMQRVLLRMGCIEFSDSSMLDKLRSKIPASTDEPVRSACIDALKLMTNVSGHAPWVMNDFFWPLGRSCCNETTLCKDRMCSKSPCTFFTITDTGDHTNCIFEPACKGAGDERYRTLWEPLVETHYY